MAYNVEVEIFVRTKQVEQFSQGIQSVDRNEFLFSNASVDSDLVEDIRYYIEKHLVPVANVEQQIV